MYRRLTRPARLQACCCCFLLPLRVPTRLGTNAGGSYFQELYTAGMN